MALPQPARRRSRIGYVVVLLAAAVFSASCFLPYHALSTSASQSAGSESLYRSFMNSGSTAAIKGGWLLFLFGGVLIVAAISALGVRRRAAAWTPAALTPVAAAWSFTWTGMLVAEPPGSALEVGYWSLVLSVLAVLTGSVFVLLSAGAEAHRQSATAPEGQPAI